MSRKIAIAVMLLSIVVLINIRNKTYASEIDITETFKDANLRQEILELAKEATGEDEKTQIYESDIDKIVEMPGGTSLRLANKGIKDLSGIEVFAGKGITWIFLDWNELTDLSPLSSLKDLTKISFSGNVVTDLTPLSSLENLRNITAINNNIETLEPIANLSNIEYICLDGNKLSSIQEISNWSNLKEISFANNLIEQIPNLEQLQQLEKINLSSNKIQSLQGVSNLEALTNLEVDNNMLTKLEGIENFNNLQILSCSNNKIVDITPITKLENLENLNLNANQIEDINVLENNTNLQFVYLDNNNILDFSVLEKLNNLSKYTMYNEKILVEIKEKITANNVLIPLPDLYTNLYDSNSFIYREGLITEVEGADDYEIDTNNSQIKLKAEDLENGNITVKVSDTYNTILIYEITLDKQAPIIQGVENNITYNGAITITSEDTDIEKVILSKNNEQVEYSLGETINEDGNYTLEVIDYAGNKTVIKFEIKKEFNEDIEDYEIKEDCIIGISSNTSLEIFSKILNANLEYEVIRDNNKVTEQQIIATGDILVTELGNKYYLIVKGDANKDGYADITDLLLLKRYLLEILTFDEYSTKAIDLNLDNLADITDLLLMRRLLIQ